jgi:hypothetical protein
MDSLWFESTLQEGSAMQRGPLSEACDLLSKLDLKKNGLWGWTIYRLGQPYRRSAQLYLSMERADEALVLAMNELRSS